MSDSKSLGSPIDYDDKSPKSNKKEKRGKSWKKQDSD